MIDGHFKKTALSFKEHKKDAVFISMAAIVFRIYQVSETLSDFFFQVLFTILG